VCFFVPQDQLFLRFPAERFLSVRRRIVNPLANNAIIRAISGESSPVFGEEEDVVVVDVTVVAAITVDDVVDAETVDAVEDVDADEHVETVDDVDDVVGTEETVEDVVDDDVGVEDVVEDVVGAEDVVEDDVGDAVYVTYGISKSSLPVLPVLEV
jgi:hypothetical protein